jgi:hypothetical protein
VDRGGFWTLVGPVGEGVVSLSSFAREVKRLEVIVEGDKWRLSLECLATWSVDYCVSLPRLYGTVVQEDQGGGWEGDMVGAEQGDCQLEVGRRAPGWDFLCPRRGTLEESHTAVNQHSH